METRNAPRSEEAWPDLPLEAWRDTCDTLHLFTQVVGKVRLALAPMEREWAQVALYVTSRGLGTSPVPYQGITFEIDFDFIEHELIVRTSDGATKSMHLVPQTVSAFHRRVLDLLRAVGIEVQINPVPQEVPKPIPFTFDTMHASYDQEYVNRFWRILVRVDTLFKQHRAGFRGRHTLIQFFWGSFDLSYSRFSGRPATPPEGADYVRRTAMDAEEVCAGFWPGDDRFPEPAFYCYAYPMPKKLHEAPVGPRAAEWNPQLGEFVLRYSDAIAAESPNAAILEFLSSTYWLSAHKARWDPQLIG